jgi:hypothetical protein
VAQCAGVTVAARVTVAAGVQCGPVQLECSAAACGAAWVQCGLGAQLGWLAGYASAARAYPFLSSAATSLTSYILTMTRLFDSNGCSTASSS